MTNHTKLTDDQYDAVNRQSYKMTPQDEAIHAGMVGRHRPAHNFPAPIRVSLEGEDTEPPLIRIAREVTQLQFTVSALDAMASEQRSIINDLMARLDKLEAAEFCRNLPSNKREMVE